MTKTVRVNKKALAHAAMRSKLELYYAIFYGDPNEPFTMINTFFNYEKGYVLFQIDKSTHTLWTVKELIDDHLGIKKREDDYNLTQYESEGFYDE